LLPNAFFSPELSTGPLRELTVPEKEPGTRECIVRVKKIGAK